MQWLLYYCARSVALLAPQAGADLLLGARQEQRFDCAVQAIGIESKFGVPLLVNPTCEFDGVPGGVRACVRAMARPSDVAAVRAQRSTRIRWERARTAAAPVAAAIQRLLLGDTIKKLATWAALGTLQSKVDSKCACATRVTAVGAPAVASARRGSVSLASAAPLLTVPQLHHVAGARSRLHRRRRLCRQTARRRRQTWREAERRAHASTRACTA